MFKKIMTCMSRPSRIGLYLNEKMFISFFRLILCAIIATLPFTIVLLSRTEINQTSKDIIVKEIIQIDEEFQLDIVDYKLTGEKELVYQGYDAVVCFNPNNKNTSNLVNVSEYPILEFNKDRVNLYVGSMCIYSKTYRDLEIKDLSFSKMMQTDYLEYDKFVSLLNTVFNSVHKVWVLAYSLFNFISMFIISVIVALILAIFSKFVNPVVGFKFRLKLALDSQYIFMFFAMLATLFSASFLEYIGLIFACIYTIKALSKIVRIEIRKDYRGGN